LEIFSTDKNLFLTVLFKALIIPCPAVVDILKEFVRPVSCSFQKYERSGCKLFAIVMYFFSGLSFSTIKSKQI